MRRNTRRPRRRDVFGARALAAVRRGGNTSGHVAELLEPRRLLSANVLSWHNDLARTGLNANETQLTTANVNQGEFGKLFSYPVDGQVYAQPLYVSNLNMGALGTHDVVFVATEHDSVYAFDADSAGTGGGLLWHATLGPAAASPPPNNAFGDRYGPYGNITPWVGITGTPVIDLSTNTMYVDAFTNDSPGAYSHHIHALDITTGADRLTPVLVAASVPGNGAGGTGTMVPFTATQQLQRPGLAIVNGVLYVAYGSYADTDPYHGWVLGFNPTTLALQSVFNTTPNYLTVPPGANPDEGAIWQSGAGPASDGTNLYFMTGNGDFDASVADYGDSFIKLNSSLQLSDYFTPSNQLSLAQADEDLGSGGPIVLPDSVGSMAHPHLLVGCGKQGLIYLIDQTNMGGYGATDNVVQEVSLGSGTWSNPVYFNGRIYLHGVGDVLKAFSISNGQLSTSPVAQGVIGDGFPGGNPSVSANGASNGIVWDLQNNAILHAYDANTLTELYNSAQAGSRDALGSYVEFTTPTIADGKVFVGTGNSVAIFGLFPPPTSPPAAPSNLTVFQGAGTAVILSWLNNASNALNFQVQRSTNGTNFSPIATVPTVSQGATASYADSNVAVGQTLYYRVLAFNNYNGGSFSMPSNIVSLTVAAPSVVFTDNYSNNTIANYTEATQTAAPTFQDSWAISGGRLNYSVSATSTWNSSVLLLNSSVANTAGLPRFSTSGDIIAPQNYQPGLILSGDLASGGFIVQEYDAGPYLNHFVLLRETGGQLLGDEGGTANPPVLADFGDISSHAGDTFHITGTIDRTGANPVITVSITDLTNSSFTLPTLAATDLSDPAGFGGTQIGWRARYQDTTASFSVDNLSIQLPPTDHPPAAPSGLVATQSAGAVVHLSWINNADNALLFQIERSSDGTNFGLLATIPAVAQGATATYTDNPSVPSGTTLYYRVLAFNGYNNGTASAPSNTVSLTITLPSVNFNDNYSTNTRSAYVAFTQTAAPTFTDSWTVSNGTLNYAVSATNGWNSSVLLLNPNIANTGGLSNFTVSGDIIAGQNFQPGLILSGDATNGGFIVQEYDAGNYVNHLVLLRETGGQLLGDEGGTANPPLLADFGSIASNEGDSFHIVATVDRTGMHPAISVSITDLTNPTFHLTSHSVTDTTDPANYGGTQIGWRARYHDTTAAFSVDNLKLQSTPSGAQDVITDNAGDQPVTLKQIGGNLIQWQFGSLIGTLPITDPNGLTINDLGGPDTLELLSVGGAPLPDLLTLDGNFVVDGALALGANQRVVLSDSNQQGSSSLGMGGLSLDPAARLDLESGTASITYSSPSPLSTIQSYLRGGQITSSRLAANQAIADIDNGSSVLLLPRVLTGDINRDGTVNFSDVLTLIQNYNHSGADWGRGDFNYDGTVNFNDVLSLIQHYGQSAAGVAAPTASVSLQSAASILSAAQMQENARKRPAWHSRPRL